VKNIERRNSGILELVILHLSGEIRARERKYQPRFSISGLRFECGGEYLRFGNRTPALPPSS
jgi:hypothetical protein